MPEQKKRKGTQKYLADFRLDDNGNYQYYGTFYINENEKSLFAGHLLKDSVYILICCICWLFCGLLPASAMNDSLVVIIPWLLHGVGLILCVPSPVRRCREKGRLRTYLYKRYIASLPAKSMCLLIVSFLCVVSRILLTVFEYDAATFRWVILFVIAETVSTASAVMLYLSARSEVVLWHEEK